jgi:hypothetical protein
MADYQVEASGGAPIQRWFFTEGNQRKKRMKTLRTPISSLNSHDSNGESGKGCHAANSLPGPVQMDIASRCSTSTSTAAKKSWAKKSQSPQTSDRAMEIARHEKARADVKQFKRDLDGLTEKPQLCELFRKGYNAKQACDALNIRPEDYRRWFENDVEFRVQLYLAVCSR